MTARARKPQFLFQREHLLLRQTAAYYSVMNENQTFRSGLRQLYEALQIATYREPTASDWQILDDFAEKWRLPRGFGAGDLWGSFFEESPSGVAVDGAGAPEISIEQEFLDPRPRWKAGELPALSTSDESRGSQTAGLVPAITPEMPPPFLYDPRGMSLDSVREYAESAGAAVRASIIRQAEELEQQARDEGWSPIHPKHQDPAALRRLALRLYRRAVLQWPWARIASEEMQGSSEWCDPQSVRTTVKAWASAIDVQLPARPPGRPKTRAE